MKKYHIQYGHRNKLAFTLIELLVVKPAIAMRRLLLSTKATARVVKIRFTLIELLVVIAIIATCVNASAGIAKRPQQSQADQLFKQSQTAWRGDHYVFFRL